MDKGQIIVIGLCIGFIVGMIFGFIILSVGSNTTIKTKALDEVCVELYGNGTESYNPLWVGPEEELKCRKILMEELTPHSRIKFIEEECKRC